MTWHGAILAALLAASAPAQTVTVIQNNGPSSNRVDLVILGDGYTAAELTKFQNDAQTFVLQMFNQDPYKEYNRYFNVRRIDVASAESGADHPELSPQVFKNTAFDATYNCSNIQRLICVNTNKVFTTVNAALAADQRDVVVIIVNDTVYGGSGGSVAVASLDPNAVEIVLHELGHTIALLADEYGGNSGPSCATSEPSEANATAQTNRSLIKWRTWIDGVTPVPTFGTAAGVPGLYEGARYCDSGLYRPTYNSKMRSLGFPFDQINTEQLVLRYYNWVNPIDASNPTSGTVSLLKPASATFSVTPTQPLNTANINIVWTLDGVATIAGPSITLNSASLSSGNHTLVATARDLTPMVRNDPSSLMVDTRSWTVTVSAGPPVLTPTWPSNGATGVPNSLTLQWSASPDVSSAYTVYFGTTNPPPMASTVASTQIDRTGLSASTTYYWRVEATGPGGLGTSSVSSFTTSALSAGGPVSGFRLNSGGLRLNIYGSNRAILVGGNFSGQPAVAVSPGSGLVTIAAHDTFSSIYIATYNPNTGAQSALEYLGGQAAGSPAAAALPSGTVYLAIRDNSGASWLHTASIGWIPLGGLVASDPALAGCPDGSLYLIAKDQWNGLWSNHYIPGTGSQGWRFGGGIIPGSPVAACGSDNAAYVAARDFWGGTWMARVAGNNWTGWFFGAGRSSMDPRITSAGSKVTVLIVDQWGGPYEADFTAGLGNGWSAWSFLGGIFGDVSPVYASGDLFVAAEAAGSKHLYWNRKSAPGWSYVGLGPTIASGLSTAGQ